MAHVYNRGTKHDPNWYVRFRDIDGRWLSRPCHQQTKALAEAYAHQIAARIAAGKVGIETPDKEPPCRDLMETWAASLMNRVIHLVEITVDIIKYRLVKCCWVTGG